MLSVSILKRKNLYSFGGFLSSCLLRSRHVRFTQKERTNNHTGIHVGDFLIGLADGEAGEKWMSEIESLYRWGSWKTSESEFAGIRVRQQLEFSITVDLEDNASKFITEAPITRERSRQRQESLTAQELSLLRGVFGTASWATQHVVQDLLDANKLVRDMPRSAAQSLHFHSFNETPWQQLVFCFMGRCERSSQTR